MWKALLDPLWGRTFNGLEDLAVAARAAGIDPSGWRITFEGIYARCYSVGDRMLVQGMEGFQPEAWVASPGWVLAAVVDDGEGV